MNRTPPQQLGADRAFAELSITAAPGASAWPADGAKRKMFPKGFSTEIILCPCLVNHDFTPYSCFPFCPSFTQLLPQFTQEKPISVETMERNNQWLTHKPDAPETKWFLLIPTLNREFHVFKQDVTLHPSEQLILKLQPEHFIPPTSSAFLALLIKPKKCHHQEMSKKRDIIFLQSHLGAQAPERRSHPHLTWLEYFPQLCLGPSFWTSNQAWTLYWILGLFTLLMHLKHILTHLKLRLLLYIYVA